MRKLRRKISDSRLSDYGAYRVKIRLTNAQLYFENLPDFLVGRTILLVSDLHTSGFKKKERQLQQLLAEGADLFICAGDSCYELNLAFWLSTEQQHAQRGLRKWYMLPVKTPQALDVWRHLLASLNCKLGAYVVQGNHDPDAFMEALAQSGDVAVLSNECRQVEAGPGEFFNVCGIRCARRSVMDVARTMQQARAELFTITVSHYPDMAGALAATGADLVLAGHTHGGQVCLPTGRALLTHSRTGQRFVAGLEHQNRTTVYTGRGLGAQLFGVRLFCPPEITRITRHRGAAQTDRVESSPL